MTPAARKWLAEKGYDPDYGARPLKRVIEKRLKDPLAEKLIEGRIAAPFEVRVDADGEELSFDFEASE